jgi:hypothetical protein
MDSDSQAVQPERLPTYSEINKYLLDHMGFAAQNYWIAHVKDLHGVRTRRRPPARSKACPEEKRSAIETALRHFGVIP